MATAAPRESGHDNSFLILLEALSSCLSIPEVLSPSDSKRSCHPEPLGRAGIPRPGRSLKATLGCSWVLDAHRPSRLVSVKFL